MNRILEVDVENHRAVVQPGVVNADLSTAVAHRPPFRARPVEPEGLHDCNVSENSGKHTLAYGVQRTMCSNSRWYRRPATHL